jgi:hypothetical protein
VGSVYGAEKQVELTPPVASINQKLLGISIGAGAIGAAAGLGSLVAGKQILPALIIGALVGGALGLGVSTYGVGLRERNEFEQYKTSFNQWKQVVSSPLVAAPFENFAGFVLEHYKDPAAFDAALKELDVMGKTLSTVVAGLEKLVKASEPSDDAWHKAVTIVCKRLLESVKHSYGELAEKRPVLVQQECFVKAELEYKKALATIIDMQKRALALTVNEEVVSVKESYEKTLAYGMTIVDEVCPLVGFAKKLRQSVKIVQDAINEFVIQRDAYAEKGKSDPRYVVLKDECDKVVNQLHNDFPMMLFEERIKEICVSDIYQKEIVVVAKEKRHKEVVEALKKINDGLNETVMSIKADIAIVKKGVLEVKDDVGTNQHKISGVDKRVTTVLTELSCVEDDIATSKEVLSSLQREFAHLETAFQVIPVDLGAQLARIEGLIAANVNTISNLEHQVGSLCLEVSNLKKQE